MVFFAEEFECELDTFAAACRYRYNGISFEPSPSRIGEVVQKVRFRASFLKKKFVLYFTIILLKEQNASAHLTFGGGLCIAAAR